MYFGLEVSHRGKDFQAFRQDVKIRSFVYRLNFADGLCSSLGCQVQIVGERWNGFFRAVVPVNLQFCMVPYRDCRNEKKVDSRNMNTGADGRSIKASALYEIVGHVNVWFPVFLWLLYLLRSELLRRKSPGTFIPKDEVLYIRWLLDQADKCRLFPCVSMVNNTIYGT